jgi:outer membrane protein assembly factor BamB
MNKLKICAVLLILAFSLSNAAFCWADDYSWPFIRHDSQNTGFSEGLAPSSNDTLWTVNIATSSRSNPIFSDGKLFVIETNRTLIAFDPTNGSVTWQAQNFSWGSALAVAYGRVFVGSYNELVAVDENSGHEIYRVKLADHLELQAINAANDKLFISSHDDYTYCVNASNGDILWKTLTYQTGAYSPPAVSDGLVFQGCYCLNETDGSIVWHYDGFYGSPPTVADGKVFFFAAPAIREDLNSSIVCLNQQTGQKEWEYSVGSFGRNFYGPFDSCTAVAYQRVFALVNGTLYVLDDNSGELIWASAASNMSLSTIPPVVVDHRVFVANHDYILGLDVDNGTVVWSYALSGARNRHIIVDGTLFSMNAESLIAVGGGSIPEFPSITAIMILLTSLLVVAIIYKRNRRN